MTQRIELWEQYPEVWATKAAFFAWLRGGLRRAIWEKYPPKIIFKNETCSPPPSNYTGRAKSGANCALTGEWVNKSNLEVDHIIGNASLRDWNDVLPFIQHLCTDDSNMQLVSKEAHKVKSYAERMGITFEEAMIEKQVIAIMKNKQKCLAFLAEHGYDGEAVSNEVKRKKLVREIIKGY